MKVIAFNASPRKNGNTQSLLEAVLKGAASKDAETRLVNLRELNVKGCLGCDACKNDLGKCVQKDDLSPLLQEMKDCDAVVLGTPVYWFHVSSQFKALVDRLYCFYGWEVNPDTWEVKEINAFPEGKKFVIVTSRGDQENARTVPHLYKHLNEWLSVVATGMRASSTQFLNHYGSMNQKDSARDDSELTSKAESIGMSLVQ
ncbi:MAG: flavodoxin family protein [Candidatus Lindowbacteria bacterium]|nr:flavodoxin family protein [Candidatus Lindowbacteria bacterium]